MSASEDARGGEGNRVVMDNHFNIARKRVEGGGADNGAGVAFVDRHMWLGAKRTSAVCMYRVENGGLVRAEDLGTPVRCA